MVIPNQQQRSQQRMSPSSSSSSIPKPTFAKDEIINGSWKIIRELGSGGCGIVYEVERIRGTNIGTRAAMKAETVDVNSKYSETLVAEALVLRRMQWSLHFCRLYLAGRPSADCNIIVMSLVGRPLSWLRRQNPSQRFTLSTALRLGIQCLKAIEDLHSIGMIHRDVKGSNFAIGHGDCSRVVHMIDFGFARFYLTKGADGKLHHRCPRRKAPYLGTDRYCSIFVHMRKEQGRRDDLWSFLYMMVEFIVGELPWRSLPYKELLPMKSRNEEHLLKDCPHEFYAIHDHIRLLDYSDRPNYELIKRTLCEICERKNYDPKDPFDWEEGGRFHEEYLRSLQKVELVKKQNEEKRKKDEKKNGNKLDLFKFGVGQKSEKHKDETQPNGEFGHEPSLKLAFSIEDSSTVSSGESCKYSEPSKQLRNLDRLLQQAPLEDDKSWNWDDDGWDLDDKHTTSEQPETSKEIHFPTIAEEE